METAWLMLNKWDVMFEEHPWVAIPMLIVCVTLVSLYYRLTERAE